MMLRVCGLGKKMEFAKICSVYEEHDSILITNFMYWLLFIHKILFSSTCFEPQVLIFRRIQLYTCSILYCHSLREFVVACRYTAWVRTDWRGKVVGGCLKTPTNRKTIKTFSPETCLICKKSNGASSHPQNPPHCSMFRATLNQSTPRHPVSLRNIILL